MSDRYNALIVLLEHDLKDEDAEPLMEAIKQFRGVLTVKPNVSDLTAILAQERARTALTEKLWSVLYPEKEEKE